MSWFGSENILELIVFVIFIRTAENGNCLYGLAEIALFLEEFVFFFPVSQFLVLDH
jgi:hypothetical protein